jgi:uncharacterized protein YyaL (SSP411 family)
MNHLVNETSPYLQQHAANPVDWYPWSREAFDKAKSEDKPVFLSIGYSSCHWCHVMAHESFENPGVAELLNTHFVAVKVDREQRPDVDSIYMNVCQMLNGSGGWPLSVFMMPEQKPFFAGTYYSKAAFVQLCRNVAEQWRSNRTALSETADQITTMLSRPQRLTENSDKLPEQAASQFEAAFDGEFGGFGSAPKFPTPHNLLFLLEYGARKTIQMVEKTLLQMYKGGIFDHIGYGFSRYSTDRYWLVPHFEKMLYDNALLTLAYVKAFEVTRTELFRDVAVKIMEYVLRELTSPGGAFYSAQDADSDGVEGKFYVFGYDEIDDKELINYLGFRPDGNFRGKNIPNLLAHDTIETVDVSQIYEYRKNRTHLHRDEKILPSWNALMIAAFASAYRVFGDEKYLNAARNACNWQKSDILLLDDYSFYIFALLQLYDAAHNDLDLAQAVELCREAVAEFHDSGHGGFFIYGSSSERLIARPKETYDGAIPSGNSVMAYNLIRLARLTESADLAGLAHSQLKFMSAAASDYPMGHGFFLCALLLARHSKVTFEDCSGAVCRRVTI